MYIAILKIMQLYVYFNRKSAYNIYFYFLN